MLPNPCMFELVVNRASRHGARPVVLVLLEVCGPDVYGIEVDRVTAALQAGETVVSVVADIRHVERGRPGQRQLHSTLPLHGCRHLRVVLERDEPGDANRLQAAAAADVLQLTTPKVLSACNRRVAGNREDGVAIRAVIEDPTAASKDDALISGKIVSHSETRPDNDSWPDVTRLGDTITCRSNPV